MRVLDRRHGGLRRRRRAPGTRQWDQQTCAAIDRAARAGSDSILTRRCRLADRSLTRAMKRTEAARGTMPAACADALAAGLSEAQARLRAAVLGGPLRE